MAGVDKLTGQARPHVHAPPAPAALQPPGAGSVPACGEFCPVVAPRTPCPLQLPAPLGPAEQKQGCPS